jgi:mannose-6-phosphate isomerase-like protein (cupin superfamily)
MSKVSKESASKVNDSGVAEDRTEEFDGYTVNFVTLRQDADLAPMLKGLPDDRCQCPHWGYVFKGKVTVRYADRDEVIGPGEAFYLPPGHTPAAVAGTEFVQFSPTDELAISEAVMAKNMQEMQGGG